MNSRDRAILWARHWLTHRDFLVLDTETTGLSDNDEAVSIGLVDKGGRVLFDSLLCHTKPSSPQALAVHGHTWEETRDAPKFRDVWLAIIDLIQDKSLIIYNAEYDLRIFDQMGQRYNISTAALFTCEVACAMQEFAAFYGEWDDFRESYRWQRLTKAARHFRISTDGAHGAVADCLMTLGVVKGMAAARLSGEGAENG